jgi:hypothetical protein
MSEDKELRSGIGELVLKNGASDEVRWEVNLKDSVIKGVLQGQTKHLKAAAKDGCAILHRGKSGTAAIAIDRYANRKAFFTTLLISTPIFFAQSILFSGLLSDGTKYGLEFSSGKGDTLQVIMPSATMWDVIPQAYEDLRRIFVSQLASSTYRVIQNVRWGFAPGEDFVSLAFDNNLPILLPLDKAGELGNRLSELVGELKAGSAMSH